jgi:hypothetical protein
MEPQSLRLFDGQLKHEIIGEAQEISFDRTI